MIKITALNEAASTENEDEYTNALTKEAQEQVALNEYNRALELLLKNRKEAALNVLEDLLNTQLLDNVEKSQVRDGRSSPMLSLKYSCFKNVASIHSELKNYHDAIDNYWEAANLDDSDVMIWYKIGIMCIEISNLEFACWAFKQGLIRNCNHWPCLDNIITVLYAIPDYMNCLMYISVALEKDPTYIKGLAFRQQIFKDFPSFQDCYKIYNCFWMSDPPLDTKYDKTFAVVLLNEANELNKKWIKASNIEVLQESLFNLSLRRSLSQYSWLELGKSLIDMYKYITDNNLNFVSQIILTVRNTEGYQTNKIPMETTCCFYNKEVDINSSIITNNFRISLEHDSDIIEVNEPEDENKSYTSEIQIIEEDSIKIPADKLCLKELHNNSSNICQTKEQNSLEYTKKYNYIPNEKDNEKTDNKHFDKLNHQFNTKPFENDEINTKYSGKDKGQKLKKRRRSSLCFLTQWAWSTSNTKRSSRARTSGRKDYERDGVILEETLKRIFPAALLPDNTRFTKEESVKINDDSMETMDMYYLIGNKENSTDGTKSTESSKPTSPAYEDHLKYFGMEQENLDVNEFIKEHTGRNNIITIMAKFLEVLCSKWNYEWPDELPELYVQSYLCMRQHLPHSSPFVKNSDDCLLQMDPETTLLFCELYTDKWLATNSHILPASSLNSLGIGISAEDLGYIIFCSTQDDLFNEKKVDFLLRLLWLKANVFLYHGDVEVSLKTFKLLLQYMQQFQFDICKPALKLMNCKYNSTICIKTVKKMLTSIQRSKQFCEIRYLYQEKKYAELSNILKDTFNFSKQVNQFILCREVTIDRVEHLQILLDSLWQLQQYEDCYVWAEACFNESWHNYLHIMTTCTTDDERNKWIQSILYSLEKLDACVSEVSPFIVKYLPESRRCRLVQNLVHIVCHQLDVLDNTPIMPIETVLPWILMHSILQYEEDKQRAKSKPTVKYKSHVSIYSESDEDEEDIPASITILLKAHEFLGRHGWCCISEGKLLIFVMKLIIPKLHFPLYFSIKRKLKGPLEQIIYCLYGHPAKFSSGVRSRPKYLEEHVKSHINLTWEACLLLFEFYKPENLPNFESKRVDSINADTVILFKKICTLIPRESDPAFIAEELNDYLLGNKKKIPNVKKPLHSNISYIYYLIADHYFKAASNQSWLCAAKYYILDLCLHPNELNSWAGLAMSTSTLMETWLNNFQPNINEERYLSKAKIAQRSYQRAIDLAPSHLTIWTEFGNFLYTVHSFCSRLLKQESDSLNMERFRILESRKEEMLDKSKYCFASANDIYTACQGIDEPQDERWLYQYMLAKIAEKKNEDPPVFLQHYSKASELLFENNAHYPKRISHKNPPNFAIEALEVYYRIHSSILKYLEQHDGKPLKRSLGFVLENSLKSCMQSPFMTYDSIFRDISKEKDSDTNETKISIHMDSCNVKDSKLFIYQNTPTVANQTIIDINKLDNRKRCSDEPIVITDIKKTKLGNEMSNVSHLQLMQEVVALIDDLITKVCDKVCHKQIEFKYHDCESKSQIRYNSSSMITEPTDNANIQHMMDDLMKPEIESRQERDQFTSGNEDIRKSDGRWMQNENLHMESFNKSEKIDERKNCNVLEGILSRRGSQESTTTTQTSTTESNNSSSSSSEDTSSSDDTSDSSSSSDSDSDSVESDMDKKKKVALNEDVYLTEEETSKLIAYCLAGLEECVLRFPEHYKSIYRLAYFFFYNKFSKNIAKCKQLLLETYECQFHPNQTISGLFAERKNTNFFNGIWRIPIHEIDRPGSFASHMSRCILLLMQVLKETGDSRMLTELCIQLRKTPDTDKKYLRDAEREQLSGQALTLCLQCLRSKIVSIDMKKTSNKVYNTRIDEQMQVLLDVYHTYQNIKNMQEYEVVELPKIRKLLEEAYITFMGNTRPQENIFELAKEWCRQKIRANKIGITSIDSNVNIRMIGANPVLPSVNVDAPTMLAVPLATQNRKPQKVSISGKPRGRPPGMNKFSQVMSSDSILFQNQYNSKHSSTSKTYTSVSHNSSNNHYHLNPFLESNMLAAMLGPSFNANIIDSAVNYLNQVGTYQDIFQHYPNNLTAISGLKVNYKQNSSNISNIQLANTGGVTNSSLNAAKERPDISITPVSGSVPLIRPKCSKYTTTNKVQNEHAAMTMQLPKSVQITPSSQLSLLKSSHVQQRISKSFIENQIPLTTSISSLGDTASINRSVSHASKTAITETRTSQYLSQPGTSLQHKLLFKKQAQRPHQSCSTIISTKKQKQNKTVLPGGYTNLLNVTTPYTSSDLSAIIVNPVPSTSLKSSSNSQISIKSKATDAQISSSSIHNTNSCNALSVLSQLQQHSHLEIIPQASNVKHGIDLSNISSRSTGPQNIPTTVNLSNTDSVSVYELPRRKVNTNFSNTLQVKKGDKCETDNVEIITLDD